MKTKPLTFILSLTFLFLFSGSVYGDVFGKTDESVVLLCSHMKTRKVDYYSVNMKDKVIKNHYSLGSSLTYKITKEDEVYIRGILEEELSSIMITKHKYENHILLEHFWIDKNDEMKTGKERYECIVGEKKF